MYDLSSHLITLDNLFIILPSGVVSKNDIGAFIIVLSNELCRVRDAT